MNEFFKQAPSQVITNTIQFTEYNLYLHGEIGEPDDFMEHFAVYKMGNEGDVIRLYINSPGGSLSTGMEYIRHMRECEATIVAVLGVEVASMASAIALEADEIEVDEMSAMLIHSFQYGTQGSEYSVFNQAQFNKRLNERWVKSHFGKFLNEDELNDVFKGVDILLDAEEIVHRWNKMNGEGELDAPCDDVCEDESVCEVIEVYPRLLEQEYTVSGDSLTTFSITLTREQCEMIKDLEKLKILVDS